MDALVDVGDGAAEKVPAENHASDPEDSPKDVVAEIPRVRHLSGAGDRRAESPDDGNKASQDDRLSAVLFIEIVGAAQMAAAEKEGIFAAVQGISGAASNPITKLVAGDGAQGHQGQKRSNGKVAGAGKNACGYKEGITGKEEADEETGFNKNNEANQKRAAPPNQSFDVIECVQQVAYEFEHAANSP